MTRSTALANNAHPLGWAIIALAIFVQSPGRTAADTKLDLLIDPGGFLIHATSAWTDIFTLGQLQNQAYGYLFPQGLFFVLTEPFPDWIAQRLWWVIVVGVGYSGFLVLLRRLSIGSPLMQVLAAGLYAFSPRTLTTLTAISSETWPVMLAPWILAALVDKHPSWRTAARATIPVALMGAVNATATLAACVPALVLLLWLRRWRLLTQWLVGCALVSVWWIGPLLVLGRYSAPFTEFIESATVTTRWLHLPEILRGTTSWATFVETERWAGWLLVSEPVFVLLTITVAALGLAGLARKDQGLWVTMLLVGVVILGAAHGPLGEWWIAFLDGAGAPLRNLHKFDPLVRIPLMVGIASLTPRHASTSALITAVALCAISPVWSARLTPKGTWDEVPDYWYQAADYLNKNAAGTRTLIVPESSFARQDWGWTRDEPAQPLLEVPWAVRDAIPLIEPEAIRGLDGIMAVGDTDALRRLGIGAVLVRHDLEETSLSPRHTQVLQDRPNVARFGPNNELEILLLDLHADLMLSDARPVTVSGGGEILALLDAEYGPGPRKLVEAGGEIISDTPMAVARNFGTLQGSVSAPLTPDEEPASMGNRALDYFSSGTRVHAVERGGSLQASSSASDSTAFGGANPARSVTAAVDKDPRTAWYPAPGPAAGEWLELKGDFEPQATLKILPANDGPLRIINGQAHQEIKVRKHEEVSVSLPGPATGTIRIEQLGPGPVGLAEVSISGTPIERVVAVPPASEDTRMVVMQRLMVDTGILLREFSLARETEFEVRTSGASVLIDGTRYRSGDTLSLPEGLHHLSTEAQWVMLTEPGFNPSPAWEPTSRSIAPAATERLLITGRSANPGLRAQIDGTYLEPRTIDAATQAFVVPAGLGGEVEFSFAGDPAYRLSLIIGGILLLLTLAGALLCLRSAGGPAVKLHGNTSWFFGALAMGLVSGAIGLGAVAMIWLVRRLTFIPPSVFAFALLAVAGAWLARAPWPTAGYAGDHPLLAAVCALALACLLDFTPRKARREGSSTNSKEAAETTVVSSAVST